MRRLFRTLPLLLVAGLVASPTLGAPAAEPAKARAPMADKARIGVLEIEGKLSEVKGGMAIFGGGGKAETLREVLAALKAAGARSDLAGIVIKLKDAKLKASQIEEIGAVLHDIRASGKKVHLYAYSYDTPDLLLGAHCDEVICQSGGAVSLPGTYVEEMYLADTLQWLGMKADFVQIGDYKGADEALVNSKPSEPWNKNFDGLLDSLYGNMRATLKTGRKLDDAGLDKAMDVAWMADAKDAKGVGLIDTILDLPDLSDHLKKAYAKDIDWEDDLMPKSGPAFDKSNPFAFFQMLMAKPEQKAKRPTIALLHIDGAIIDGDSTGGGLLGGEGSVGSLTIRRSLSEIENDDLIKGLLVRIDSPGGSAIASEVIWQGLRRVAAKGKPVWVSVGSMAASGGYYIAVGSDKIYVNPSSIVGSIGVVGGKIAMHGLYDMVKIRTYSRARGPRANMMGSSAWTPADLALVRQKMTETYTLFTSRVSAGRKGIELNQTAEGRLFTGNKAIDLKMADKMGGVEIALADLAKQLSLADNAYDVLDYPPAKTLEDLISGLMGGASAAAPISGSSPAFGELTGLAHELMGDDAFQSVRDSLTGLLQLRKEPVLLISPSAIIVR